MTAKFMKVIDKFGNELNYEIILAFKWYKTNKNYIVYTDNTKTITGKLNLYASIYYPKDDSKLDNVETEEEWQEIERRINALSECKSNE